MKAPAPSETQIQAAFFQAWRLFSPRNAIAFSVPNEAKRTKTEAARLKAQGLWPGCADVIVLVLGRAPLALEFKSGVGRQTAEQKDFADAFRAVGGVYVVARSEREALDVARGHGAELPGEVGA